MKWRYSPCFNQETDPIIVTVTAPIQEQTEEAIPTAPTMEFLVGQLTTLMEQTREQLATMSTEVESLRSQNHWTESSIMELFQKTHQVEETIQETLEEIAEEVTEAVEEVIQSETEQQEGSNQLDGLPEIPPQAPEEIQQQTEPEGAKKSLFHWKRWL